MNFQASTNSAFAISEAELDRLEILLEDPALEAAMYLDELHGYLCAALSGPRPASKDRWADDILGDIALRETEAGGEAWEIICRLADSLRRTFESGNAPELYLYPREEEDEDASAESGEESAAPEYDFAPWCEGYLHGIDSAEADWFDSLDDEEEIDWLDECLFPLMFFSGEAQAAAEQHGDEWPQGEELAELEQNCAEALPEIALEIYRFWNDKQTRMQEDEEEA
ncbi:MAG: YecA family protein [Betaproteobacteria bacterium]|nr:YecA family protein [Betaproteobacteria bacterium]